MMNRTAYVSFKRIPSVVEVTYAIIRAKVEESVRVRTRPQTLAGEGDTEAY
jgi:hypothetical protein